MNIDDIIAKYSKVIFVDNLSDSEVENLLCAYYKGGYMSDGPLYANGVWYE